MTEIEILEELACIEARESFYAYRQYINPKLKLGWWQREVATELQQFYEDLSAGHSPKLVIQSPPQHGKSTIVIDFLSWIAGKDSSLRTIYTSFSERLGIRANLRMQRIMDGQKYHRVFGARIGLTISVTISSQLLRNREILEYIGAEGYFRNTTVCGSITGESLDLGVIDDPIKGREQAQSSVIRQKTWDWLTDDFFTRFSEHAGLLVILTRWHVDDPIGRLLEKDKTIKLLTYPAIAIKDDTYRRIGEALFPEHKSIEFLENIRSVMAVSSFEALYQQAPVLMEGNLFKPDNIPIIDALPEYIQYVRAWDLASTAGGGDWTVGAKIGITSDGSRIIIADIVRLRGSPEEVEATIKNTAQRDGKECTIRLPQDPGQAGKAQIAYLTKQLIGFNIHSTPVSGDKITRAEPFASQCNVGNISMLKAGWNDQLVDEMRMFPNGTFDDQIDAGSDAFSEISLIYTGDATVEVFGSMTKMDW
jgi:predicted phage terminase large subunit-like protein